MKTNIINNHNNIDYSDLINHVLSIAENQLQINNKEINIILVSNEEIQNLNKTYRSIDNPTDVLTFPDDYLNNLGDIFISLQMCESQAYEYKHSFERELGFLVVHGLLHTLSYNHKTIEDENVMFKMQDNILEKAKLDR